MMDFSSRNVLYRRVVLCGSQGNFRWVAEGQGSRNLTQVLSLLSRSSKGQRRVKHLRGAELDRWGCASILWDPLWWDPVRKPSWPAVRASPWL